MRKMISGLLWAVVSGVVLLSGVSCEKMIVGDDGDSDANVVLRVTSFEQVPFSLARTRSKVAGEVCTRLNFIIFDESGEKRLNQVSQELGNESFGTASFYLSDGKYRIVVVAHSSNGNPTSTDITKIGFTNTNGFSDTFFAYDTLTVSGNEIERPLNLKRIVSKVKFDFIDELPSRTTGVKFSYNGGSGKFNALDEGWGSVKSEQAMDFKCDGSEKTFEVYTIPRKDSDHLWMRVNAYNGPKLESGVELSNRVIESIPIKRNCVTICRGVLFSPVYGAQFDIRIEDIWEPDTLEMSF